MVRRPNRRRLPLLLLLVPALVAGCAADTPDPSQGPPAGRSGASTAPGGTAGPTGTTPPGGSGRPVPSARPDEAGQPAEPRRPRFVFPVRARNVSYHPTHSAYPGTDIFAACGAPVLAVTDGQILEVSRVDRFDKRGPLGPYNGGLSVSLLGDDGVRYYGSHLTTVTAGLDTGTRVRAGQQVGTVGRTGNANNVCHLHFGISPPCQGADGWWIRRGVIWPARYLDAWRAGKDRAPGPGVASWHRKHGCPKAP